MPFDSQKAFADNPGGSACMPRLKLKPLESYAFATEITVRITDLNYGGHLGNDSLLSLLHEARVAFLADFGFTELDCGGVSLTMGDAVMVFQGEAFAGERLRFEVAAGEATDCGFRVFYRVMRVTDNQKIALAETGMVCFDYTTRTIKPLPDVVRDICMQRKG